MDIFSQAREKQIIDSNLLLESIEQNPRYQQAMNQLWICCHQEQINNVLENLRNESN